MECLSVGSWYLAYISSVLCLQAAVAVPIVLVVVIIAVVAICVFWRYVVQLFKQFLLTATSTTNLFNRQSQIYEQIYLGNIHT